MQTPEIYMYMTYKTYEIILFELKKYYKKGTKTNSF